MSGQDQSLVMRPLESQMVEENRWEYMDKKVGYKKVVEPNNVKNSQFTQPLFEFSGACAGCGETPYIKLISQLFGERMMVAMLPDVPLSMEVLLLLLLIVPTMRADVDRPGRTHCSKTMLNSDSVWPKGLIVCANG